MSLNIFSNRAIRESPAAITRIWSRDIGEDQQESNAIQGLIDHAGVGKARYRKQPPFLISRPYTLVKSLTDLAIKSQINLPNTLTLPDRAHQRQRKAADHQQLSNLTTAGAIQTPIGAGK